MADPHHIDRIDRRGNIVEHYYEGPEVPLRRGPPLDVARALCGVTIEQWQPPGSILRGGRAPHICELHPRPSRQATAGTGAILMGGSLPPGCTDEHVNAAAPEDKVRFVQALCCGRRGSSSKLCPWCDSCPRCCPHEGNPAKNPTR